MSQQRKMMQNLIAKNTAIKLKNSYDPAYYGVKDIGEAVILKVAGQSWRCECGANVLTSLGTCRYTGETKYSCNGCPRVYTSKK